MPTPDWFLPELTFAGAEHLDTEDVRRYEEKAGATSSCNMNLLGFSPLLQELSKLAKVQLKTAIVL